MQMLCEGWKKQGRWWKWWWNWKEEEKEGVSECWVGGGKERSVILLGGNCRRSRSLLPNCCCKDGHYLRDQSSSISISHQPSLVAITVTNARCRRNCSLGDCDQTKIPRRQCCLFFSLPLLTHRPTISLPFPEAGRRSLLQAVHTGQCPGPLYGRDMAR
jgi:hypothetical protein